MLRCSSATIYPYYVSENKLHTAQTYNACPQQLHVSLFAWLRPLRNTVQIQLRIQQTFRCFLTEASCCTRQYDTHSVTLHCHRTDQELSKPSKPWLYNFLKLICREYGIRFSCHHQTMALVFRSRLWNMIEWIVDLMFTFDFVTLTVFLSFSCVFKRGRWLTHFLLFNIHFLWYQRFILYRFPFHSTYDSIWFYFSLFQITYRRHEPLESLVVSLALLQYAWYSLEYSVPLPRLCKS